jgi:prevent-host-death family protein
LKSISARDAKYGFGRLIDLARGEPVTVAKHGRPFVVVMAVEEFERLKSLDPSAALPAQATPEEVARRK